MITATVAAVARAYRAPISTLSYRISSRVHTGGRRRLLSVVGSLPVVVGWYRRPRPYPQRQPLSLSLSPLDFGDSGHSRRRARSCARRPLCRSYSANKIITAYTSRLKKATRGLQRRRRAHFAPAASDPGARRGSTWNVDDCTYGDRCSYTRGQICAEAPKLVPTPADDVCGRRARKRADRDYARRVRMFSSADEEGRRRPSALPSPSTVASQLARSGWTCSGSNNRNLEEIPLQKSPSTCVKNTKNLNTVEQKRVQDSMCIRVTGVSNRLDATSWRNDRMSFLLLG